MTEQIDWVVIRYKYHPEIKSETTFSNIFLLLDCTLKT
jgi:hypothetical protein